MDRRACLHALTWGLVAPAGTVALAAEPAPSDALPPGDCLADFRAARAGHPWTQGYASLPADAPERPMQVRGRWPAELQGAFWRNGPGLHELGGLRYRHWFDGDGLVQRYRIDGGRVTHAARYVRTPKFVEETAAGQRLFGAFGTPVPEARMPSADAINVANTSLVWHGGRLLALWEAGSATRLDPGDLGTIGTQTWSPALAGMPFSAHPKREVDGTLWNFGVSGPAGAMVIYRIDAQGRLVQSAMLQVPDTPMVHDFAVTENHLVFLLPPFVYERGSEAPTFLGRHRWRPELGLRVMVVPKATLTQPRWFELPAGFVFHIGNACEDRGVIRLDCAMAGDSDLVEHAIPNWMHGHYAPSGKSARAVLVELDLASGRARRDVLPHRTEFPKVDPRVVGRAYTDTYGVLRLAPGDRPGFDAVMRLDVASGGVDHFRYGPDLMVEEHVLVPPARGSGRGWLVGTALDIRRRAMLLSVFDADRLGDGPVAQAEIDRPMPLGLHAIFVRA